MKKLIILLAALAASPAMAEEAEGPFLSLHNPGFVILLAFILFVAVLVYFKVPALITGMLDKRAEQIRVDLEEARLLREEAQTILASYERKQKDVQAQGERIVAQARDEAMAAAEQAKADLAGSIKRRVAAAEEQLAAAEGAALREVRDRAVSVAVAAAGEVMAKQMTAKQAGGLVDSAIDEVAARLN